MGSGLIASPRATRPAKDGFGGRRTEDGERKRVPSSVVCPLSSEGSKTGYRNTEDGMSIRPPSSVLCRPRARSARRALANESDQVERAISTGKLRALPRFHIRPIDVVVFHGSSGRTGFEAGFPLRCLQRLSIPYIATLHCGWRHNRSTRDTFTPVLSY